MGNAAVQACVLLRSDALPVYAPDDVDSIIYCHEQVQHLVPFVLHLHDAKSYEKHFTRARAVCKNKYTPP